MPVRRGRGRKPERPRDGWTGRRALPPGHSVEAPPSAEAVESHRQIVAEADPAAAREIARLGALSPEAAWRWIAEQRAAGRASLASPNLNDFLAATSYAELGDMESAIAALERSVAEHEPGMEYFGLSPDFDPIRDTPRFRALIEKMGLTAHHEKYGVFERARRRVYGTTVSDPDVPRARVGPRHFSPSSLFRSRSIASAQML